MTEAERSAQLARHIALGHRICTADEPYQAGGQRLGQRVLHVDAERLPETSGGTSHWHCPHCGLTFAWPPGPTSPSVRAPIEAGPRGATGPSPAIADTPRHRGEAGRV
jgi:hypothetical protein